MSIKNIRDDFRDFDITDNSEENLIEINQLFNEHFMDLKLFDCVEVAYRNEVLGNGLISSLSHIVFGGDGNSENFEIRYNGLYLIPPTLKYLNDTSQLDGVQELEIHLVREPHRIKNTYYNWAACIILTLEPKTIADINKHLSKNSSQLKSGNLYRIFLHHTFDSSNSNEYSNESQIHLSSGHFTQEKPPYYRKDSKKNSEKDYEKDYEKPLKFEPISVKEFKDLVLKGITPEL